MSTGQKPVSPIQDPERRDIPTDTAEDPLYRIGSTASESNIPPVKPLHMRISALEADHPDRQAAIARRQQEATEQLGKIATNKEDDPSSAVRGDS